MLSSFFFHVRSQIIRDCWEIALALRLSNKQEANLIGIMQKHIVWVPVQILDRITNDIRPSATPKVFSCKWMHSWSDGVVQMQLEGHSKIGLVLLCLFSHRQSGVLKPRPYMLMCVITHPSESHIGIYTQSLHSSYLLPSGVLHSELQEHVAEKPPFSSEKEIS